MEHEENSNQNYKQKSKTTTKENSAPEKKQIGRRILLWLLLIFLLLVVSLYLQQWFLDLEAQAIVAARRTAETHFKSEESEVEEEFKKNIPTSTIIPSLTSTKELEEISLTATIASQLTNVAEFQKTITPQD